MKVKSFWISALIFSIVVLGYILWSLYCTENYFTYILDDAYIHLSVAKNFALHKVWGIAQYQFSSTSSSPLYTFLLSYLIYIFGNKELIPLFLNMSIGLACIYLLNKYFSGIFRKTGQVVAAVIFTLFYSVFHMQILSGMEHPLQVLLIIINVMNMRKWWISDFKNQDAAYWFYFTIALLGLVRFESMFYFAALAFCFLLLKKFKTMMLVLILGFLPIVIFGYFNYLEGGYFFPNSVLVKGSKPHSGALLEQLYLLLIHNTILNTSFYKVIFFPLLFIFYLLWKDWKEQHSFQKAFIKNFILIVLGLTMIQHCVFANFRGFFRYESYIMVTFSMIAIPRIFGFFQDFRKAFRQDFIVGGLVVMNIVLLIYKTGFAHYMLQYSSKNIYEQQIQSARFLHQYYNTSKVIANDIGAISYFTDIHLLDVVGLGSTEMVPFNEDGKEFDKEFKNFLTNYGKKNKFDLAIVYDSWMGEQIPDTWMKAADFYVSPVVAIAVDKVSIYAVNPDGYKTLEKNVRNFKWNKNDRVEFTKPKKP